MAGPIYSEHPAGTVAQDWVTVALPYEYAKRRSLDSGAVEFVDDSGGTVRPAVRRKTRGRQSIFFDILGAWSSGSMAGEIRAAAAHGISAFSAHADVSGRMDVAPTVTWNPQGTGAAETLTQLQSRDLVLNTAAERKWVYRFGDAADTVVVVVERTTRNDDPVETWHWTPHRRKLTDNGRREAFTIDVGAGTVVIDEATKSYSEVSVSGSTCTFDDGVDWGVIVPISFHSYYGDGSDPREAAAGHRPAAMFDGWGDSAEARIFAMGVRPATNATEEAVRDSVAAWNAASNGIYDRRPYTPLKGGGSAGSQRFGLVLSGSMWDASESLAVRDASRMFVEDSCLRPWHWVAADGHYYTASDQVEVIIYERRPFAPSSPTGPGSFYEEIGSAWPPKNAPNSGRDCSDEEHPDDIDCHHWDALFDDSWLISQTHRQLLEREMNAARLFNGYIGTSRAWGRTCSNLATSWWVFGDTDPLGLKIRWALDTKFEFFKNQWHGRLIPSGRPILPVVLKVDSRLAGGRYMGYTIYEDSTCANAFAMMGHVLPEKAVDLWTYGLNICKSQFALSMPTGTGYPQAVRWWTYTVGLYDKDLRFSDPELGNPPPADFYNYPSATYTDRSNDNPPTDGWTYWVGSVAYLISYLEEGLEELGQTVTPAYVSERAEVLGWVDAFFGDSSRGAALVSEFFRMTACPTSYAESPLVLGDDPGGPIVEYDSVPPVGLPGGGGPGGPIVTIDPGDPVGLPDGSTSSWRRTGGVGRQKRNTIDWRSKNTTGLPGRSMADVPGILIIGDSQVNGGPSGPSTRMDSSRDTAVENLADHSLMRVIPSDDNSGAPNASTLGWYPWWNGLASADLETVSAGTSTTVTVSPSPGWTTNEHAGRRVTIVTDNTTAGWLNHEVVVSNTADTITVASWSGGTPSSTQRLFVGDGRWSDYHPAQGYLHSTELATYSQRSGSAWGAGGVGIGPDAGIMREFWDRVFRSDPWFQLAKFTTALPTVGNWGTGGDARDALEAELTRMSTAWSAQGGGNTLDWELAVIDLSQADVQDWEDTPTNALLYQDALINVINDVRTLLSKPELKVVLVNHDEGVNQQKSYYGTQFCTRIHNTLASVDANVTVANLEGARLSPETGSVYAPDENFPGYAAHEYYDRYAIEVRKAYERLITPSSGAFDSAVSTVMMIGDEIIAGAVDEPFAQADDSDTYTATARDSSQSIHNAQNGLREAYNLGANSNTSGTVDLFGGPDFSMIADLEKVWPDGVFVVKRGSRLSGLAASPTVYSGTGQQGGRWDRAYIGGEHYGPLGTLFDQARASMFVNDNEQADLRAIVVSLGTQDQQVTGGGALFEAALPGFVADLRTDFATRAGDDVLPIIWVIPQLDHALSDDDESREIRAALRAYDKTDARFVTIDIDDLERDADNQNLTARSQVTLGQRIATAVYKMSV
jgi:hypothetical protein